MFFRIIFYFLEQKNKKKLVYLIITFQNNFKK